MYSLRAIVFFLLLVSISGIFFGVQSYYRGFSYDATALKSPVPTPSSSIPSPMPIVRESAVTSPDGTMQLVMQTTTKKDTLVDYSFFTQKASGENKKAILVKTAADGEFSLPQNSWSPDNVYVFILQNQNASKNALVMKASGDAFSNNDVYIDILPIFTKKGGTYEIADITGWDSETLLHVQTRGDGGKGPAFWFEVPSRVFIQLWH